MLEAPWWAVLSGVLARVYCPLRGAFWRWSRGREGPKCFFSKGEGDVYFTSVLERLERIECTVTVACANATHAQTVDRRPAEAERSRPSPTEFESAAVPVVTPRGYEPVGISDDVVLQS